MHSGVLRNQSHDSQRVGYRSGKPFSVKRRERAYNPIAWMLVFSFSAKLMHDEAIAEG